MQRVILAIVGLVVGLMLVATLLPDVVDEAVSEAYSENFEVTTASAETTGTVELGYDHYYGDLTGLSATSDNSSDNPTVMSYNEDTREVVVGGLVADSSRILTINYYREANQQYTGFSAFLRMIPFICIISLVVASLWGLFSYVRNR